MVNNCVKDLPTIYVDTASVGVAGGAHEAVGVGLVNYHLFIQQVLNARDAVKQGTANGISSYNNNVNGSTTQQAMMDRGNAINQVDIPTASSIALTIEQRFEDVQKLYDSGYITRDEYEIKCKEILSSL